MCKRNVTVANDFEKIKNCHELKFESSVNSRRVSELNFPFLNSKVTSKSEFFEIMKDRRWFGRFSKGSWRSLGRYSEGSWNFQVERLSEISRIRLSKGAQKLRKWPVGNSQRNCRRNHQKKFYRRKSSVRPERKKIQHKTEGSREPLREENWPRQNESKATCGNVRRTECVLN